MEFGNLVENPEDPDHYVCSGVAAAEAPHGYPTLWETSIYKQAATLLKLTQTHGDQGPYGHPGTKPTTWASNRPLPKLTNRGPGKGGDEPGMGQSYESSSWSDWAPGVVQHLMDELCQVKKALFDYDAHVRRGHWPPYRGCPQCVLGQACQRPHRRVRIPEAFSLSLDLAGPYAKGLDDVSSKRRFALVGVYLLPLDRFGGPLLSEAQREQVQNEGYISKVKSETVEGEAGLGVFSDSELAEDLDGLLHIPDPESVRDESVREEAVEKDGFVELKPDEEQPHIRFVEIPFVQLLDTKRPSEVANGISAIASRLRSYGFPITRVHTDAGREFTSGPLEKLARSRGWEFSHAGPQEPNSAGRAENAVRRLKAQARTYLAQVEDAKKLWPLAFRAAAHVWSNQVLERLGWKQKPLSPWGTKVQVLVRSWLCRRQQDWRPRAEAATVLAPATYVRNAVVVINSEGKLKVATRVYKPEAPEKTDDAHDEVGGDDARDGGRNGDDVEELEVVPAGPVLRRRTKGPSIPARRVRRKCRLDKIKTDANPWDADERCARALLQAETFDEDAARELILSSMLVGSSDKPHMPRTKGAHHVFGLWRHGGIAGTTRYVDLCPSLTRVLTTLVSRAFPHCCFTTVLVSVDSETVVHRDVNNSPNHPNLVVPISVPQSGGGVWIELGADEQPVGETSTQTLSSGRELLGQVLALDKPLEFDARKWHRVLPPSGPAPGRVVVVGYTVSHANKAKPCDLAKLISLGFRLPDEVRQGGAPSSQQQKSQKTQKKHKILKTQKHESTWREERGAVVCDDSQVACEGAQVRQESRKEPASGQRNTSASESVSCVRCVSSDVRVSHDMSDSDVGVKCLEVCDCSERDCSVCARKFVCSRSLAVRVGGVRSGGSGVEGSPVDAGVTLSQ